MSTTCQNRTGSRARRARLALACLLALGTAAAQAQSPEALARLAEQAVREALAQPGQELVLTARLDARTRMPPCGGSITSALPQRLDGSSVTVTLRCSGPRPWTLYVPVAVSRKVMVAVLRVPLARGTPLAAEHVTFRLQDVATLPRGWFGEQDLPAGRLARRHLPAGAVLAPADLESPRLVRRGQRVTIVTRGNGILIRAQGTALASGAAGDWIRVRNASSGRIIEGRVRSENEIEVPL